MTEYDRTQEQVFRLEKQIKRLKEFLSKGYNVSSEEEIQKTQNKIIELQKEKDRAESRLNELKYTNNRGY